MKVINLICSIAIKPFILKALKKDFEVRLDALGDDQFDFWLVKK
jgi:hypothetical protein